jgi:hypothetical protein
MTPHVPAAGHGTGAARLLGIPGRVDQLAERDAKRDRQRPQRLHARVARPGLQLRQSRLGDSRPAGDLGQRQAGPRPLSAQRDRDQLHQVRIPASAQEVFSLAAAVLLVSLAATLALTRGHGFAGWARPAGVAVAGLLAARRAPFRVVVIAAAATTALLRLAGIS